MALTTALMLAFEPVTAIAAPAPPAEVPPDAAPPEGIPIVEIIPPPERARIEPQPEVVPPAPEVIPAPEQAPDTAQAPTKTSKTLHNAGIGLIATGGVVAASGLGVTLAFTIIGDVRQNAAEPVLEDIEQANDMALVGGVLLASGIALVAIGGIILGRGRTKAEPQSSARIRVTPSPGGLVLRF